MSENKKSTPLWIFLLYPFALIVAAFLGFFLEPSMWETVAFAVVFTLTVTTVERTIRRKNTQS